MELLQQTWLFADLEDAEALAIEDLGDELQIKGPDVLIEAGTPCGFLFIVVDGLLSLSVPRGLNFMDPVGRLEAGSLYGELCWMEKSASPLQLKCLGPSTVLRISFEKLDAFLANLPDLERRILRRLARQLAQQVRRHQWIPGAPHA